MVARWILAPAAATTAAGTVVGLAPLFRPGAVASTAVACATLAAMATMTAEARKRLGWILLVPALVSLTATAVVLATDTGTDAPAPGTTLEVAALLLLLIHVTRWDAGWSLAVVAAATAAAQILWMLRYTPDDPWWLRVLACAFWGLGSAVAVVFGAYPRWAAGRLHRTVASAQKAQQRQLERDLHDYVAHDLSGMIVQAQAARYAAAGDATALAAALQRIEEAGHRAMSSMDRALLLLRVDEPQGQEGAMTHPGIEELPALVDRFREATSARTRFDSRGVSATLPREVGEILYRTASEGLTNIHRHGGAAVTEVVLTLETTSRSAELTIVNSCSRVHRPATPRHQGGTGLGELQGKVAALGGTLEAGPVAGGWRLAVVVPFAGPRTA